MFDSRLATTDDLPLATGDVAQIQPSRDVVTGASRLPEWEVPAVVVRFTVLSPSRAGSISVFPGTEDWNGSASISFGAGASVQQQLTTVLGPDGRLQLRNNAAVPILMVADVLGYYLGAPNPLHYTSGQEIDPRHGRLAAVSCPTATFCMTAQAAGYAERWNGSNWGTSVKVAQAATLATVSCPSPSFCLAGGTTGSGQPQLYSFNGSSWSNAAILTGPAGAMQVSCASASFCLATGQSTYRTFDGANWSAERATGGQLRSLSCPTASFCLAVDQLGKVYTFNGSGWSAPSAIDGFAPWAVSCTAATFCAAVGQTSAAVFDGTAWTVTGSLVAGRSLLSVSCASSTECRAVDNQGGVISYDGQAWSAPVAADPNGGAAISCAGSGTCVVIDTSAKETAAVFDGTSWSAPRVVDLVPGDLDGVSCLATDFCVAVDTGGYALSYDGTNWTLPAQIDGGIALTAVSCTSPSICVAVDAAGRALTFDGSTWSSPVSVDPGRQLTGGVLRRPVVLRRGRHGRQGVEVQRRQLVQPDHAVQRCPAGVGELSERHVLRGVGLRRLRHHVQRNDLVGRLVDGRLGHGVLRGRHLLLRGRHRVRQLERQQLVAGQRRPGTAQRTGRVLPVRAAVRRAELRGLPRRPGARLGRQPVEHVDRRSGRLLHRCGHLLPDERLLHAGERLHLRLPAGPLSVRPAVTLGPARPGGLPCWTWTGT